MDQTIKYKFNRELEKNYRISRNCKYICHMIDDDNSDCVIVKKFKNNKTYIKYCPDFVYGDVQFSPNSKFLGIYDIINEYVILIDIKTNNETHIGIHSSHVFHGMFFSGDSNFIAILHITRDYELVCKICDIKKRTVCELEPVKLLNYDEKTTYEFDFNCTLTHGGLLDDKKKMYVWDLKSGKLIFNLVRKKNKKIDHVKFSPVDPDLIIMAYDHCIRFFNFESETPSFKIINFNFRPNETIGTLQVNDDRILVVRSSKSNCYIIDSYGRILWQIKKPLIRDVSFNNSYVVLIHDDGHQVYSYESNKDLFGCDERYFDGQNEESYDGHEVKISSDGKKYLIVKDTKIVIDKLE